MTTAVQHQSKPPFDNLTARKALALLIRRRCVQRGAQPGPVHDGIGSVRSGRGRLPRGCRLPHLRPGRGEEAGAQYEQETGQPLAFTIASTTDSETKKDVQYVQQLAEKAGMKVTTEDRRAGLADQHGARRRLPGDRRLAQPPRRRPGRPVHLVAQRAPTNFGRIKDPEVDALLEPGRVEADPAKRKTIYEDLNRRFAEQVDNVWLSWVDWNIASNPNVFGVYGPDNPDGSKPFPGLANGHSVAGLWVAKS